MPDTKPEPSQVDKFRDLARQFECDEDEKAFEEKVRRVAKTPPQKSKNSAEGLE